MISSQIYLSKMYIFLNYAQLVHPLVYDIYLRYKQPNNPHSSRHIVYMQCYIGTHDFGLN